MISIIRLVFLTLLFFNYPDNNVIAGGGSYSGPDDGKAVMAAEEAVGRLGKDRGTILIDRGAVLINYKSVGIEGLAAGISSESIDIEENLKDLNARKVGTEIQISISGDVLFDFDESDINPRADDTLSKIAKVAKKLQKNTMLIEGHTDSKGSDLYNLRLSQQRADSVKDWFSKKGGLSQVKFTTRGYGESRPVVPNEMPNGSDDPEGRAKNRRVEIRLQN